MNNEMIGFREFELQGEEIISLQKQIRQNRLVHAVLITGEPGVGKKTLAGLLASSLMCSSETEKPCGRCSGCRLALSGEHPDITYIRKGVPISPEASKGRTTIPVDDIREMIRLCSQYSYEGGNRAVIISDAENMTVQAQNCLLKILEEPPKNTYFFITSAHPEQVLVTVRSRCRPVRLIPWDTQYIAKILTDSGIEQNKAKKAASVSSGSIGNAFRFASDDAYWALRDQVMKEFFANRRRSDILAISSGWKDRKAEADLLFSILEENIAALLKHRLEPESSADISDFPAAWICFADRASPERFAVLLDRIRAARKQNAYNVSFQAVIEQLLLIFIGESDLWVS